MTIHHPSYLLFLTCHVVFDQSAVCTSKKLVILVVISQSEMSELYITLAIIGLFRRFSCSLSSYWYILHILWLRFPERLLRYWYNLSDLAVPLVAYLDTWYLLPERTSIAVPSFQMNHAVLKLRNSGPHVRSH